MPRTSTATEIAFAISVSRRLKGCGDASGSSREAGAAEETGANKESHRRAALILRTEWVKDESHRGTTLGDFENERRVPQRDCIRF